MQIKARLDGNIPIWCTCR